MTSMEVPMTLETFRSYVMPVLLGRLQEGEDKVVTGLKGAGLSLPIVANSLVAYHIDKDDIQTAARVGELLFFIHVFVILSTSAHTWSLLVLLSETE